MGWHASSNRRAVRLNFHTRRRHRSCGKSAKASLSSHDTRHLRHFRPRIDGRRTRLLQGCRSCRIHPFRAQLRQQGSVAQTDGRPSRNSWSRTIDCLDRSGRRAGRPDEAAGMATLSCRRGLRCAMECRAGFRDRGSARQCRSHGPRTRRNGNFGRLPCALRRAPARDRRCDWRPCSRDRTDAGGRTRPGGAGWIGPGRYRRVPETYAGPRPCDQRFAQGTSARRRQR